MLFFLMLAKGHTEDSSEVEQLRPAQRARIYKAVRFVRSDKDDHIQQLGHTTPGSEKRYNTTHGNVTVNAVPIGSTNLNIIVSVVFVEALFQNRDPEVNYHHGRVLAYGRLVNAMKQLMDKQDLEPKST